MMSDDDNGCYRPILVLGVQLHCTSQVGFAAVEVSEVSMGSAGSEQRLHRQSISGLCLLCSRQRLIPLTCGHDDDHTAEATNKCMATHTHTHTRTHTHTHKHTHTQTHTHSHTSTHKHTHTLSLTHTLTPVLLLKLTPSLTREHTRIHGEQTLQPAHGRSCSKH